MGRISMCRSWMINKTGALKTGLPSTVLIVTGLASLNTVIESAETNEWETKLPADPGSEREDTETWELEMYNRTSTQTDD